MTRLLLFGLMFLFVACAVPEVSTPAPTPEPIEVFYPISLQVWADKIAGCAAANPLIALYFHQTQNLDIQTAIKDIVLELGEPSQIDDDSYLSQIGSEKIVIIVNQDNNITQLSTDELQSIFSSQSSSWSNDTAMPGQVWVYPDGDPVRRYFDRAVLGSNELTTQAMLAPDPSAMLEAISSDVNAIGYLPQSMLASYDSTMNARVKLVQLDPSIQEGLHQPVIAITHSEPEGMLRELLVCLQSAIP